MAKRAVKIDIVGEELRSLLSSQGGSLSDVAERLGVSRQALYSWISSEKLPLPRLLTLSKAFSLTPEQINSLKASEQVALQFRAHRHKEVPEDVRKRIKQIAKEVVNQHQLLPQSKQNIQLHIESDSVDAVAQQIRNVLELPEHPITLPQILASIRRLNLPVLFIPFDEELAKMKVKGFAATCSNREVIFLDDSLHIQDVPFNLLHEITHIVLGNSDGHCHDEEEFCNAVACEILTPRSFFLDSRMKSLFKNALKEPSSNLIRLIEEVANHLGASFAGVVIALQNYKILPKKSGVSRYLWKVINNKQKRYYQVSELVTPEAGEDIVSFWLDAMEDPYRSQLLQYHKLILNGLISENVSLSRAAEVFGCDVVTMREILLARGIESGEEAATH